MTTIADRPNTALVVVDVQNDVAALVERARAADVPVVWVQHADDGLPEGSDGWQYVPELVRRADEAVVHKRYGDSFEATDLEDVLAGAHVGHLVVVGAESDACVRSTLHGAFVRGYDTILVEDAHTAGDRTAWGAPPPDQVVAHTNLHWSHQAAPGREAGTVATSDADF